MREKTDDLKEKKALTDEFVPLKEGEAKENKSPSGEKKSSSSKPLFSRVPKRSQRLDKGILDDDLGDLDAFDELGSGDFSFVPKDRDKGQIPPVKGPPRSAVESQLTAPKTEKAGKETGEDGLSGLPFGEADLDEKPAELRKTDKAGVKVNFRAPKVRAARIDPVKVYGQVKQVSPAAEQAKTNEEDVKEARPAPAPSSEVLSPGKNPKEDAREVEVIPASETKPAPRAKSSEGAKPLSKWAFWKRASQRDEQLARISDGYLEMVDLVRAIRGQLESQNENNLILRDSLAHLPKAMKGIDNFSESQETVGKALQEIHGQLERTRVKDDKLVDSMDGFNMTLQGMDVTSRATMKTFDRVQERMGDSDRRMENLFSNVKETEEKVSDTMVRLQRNMAIMQGIFLFCLLVVLGVLVFVVMKNLESPAESSLKKTPSVEATEAGPSPHQVSIPREPKQSEPLLIKELKE